MNRELGFKGKDPLASQFGPYIPISLEGEQIVSGLRKRLEDPF